MSRTETPTTVSLGRRPLLSRQMVLVICIALAAGAGLMAGVSFLFSGSPTSAPAVIVPAVPEYYAFDVMTVDLASEDGHHHVLRLGLTFKCADPASRDELKESVPEIRSRIILALSEKTPADLLTPEGKMSLAADIRTIATHKYSPGAKVPSVEAVFFTEFVVQ